MKSYKIKSLLLILVIIFGIGFGVFFTTLKYANERAAALAGLQFSNTQILGIRYQSYLNHPLTLVPDFYENYILTPPPLNTSQETQEEIRHLKELANNRTDADIISINNTLDLTTTEFNNSALLELLAVDTRPHSHELVFASFGELTQIIMEYKVKFDRVRPSYLDTTLSTVIPVPNHPAYPSGHAAQSMLIALILGELDPENRESYLATAQDIALYREIAGVHYPSDSRAGQHLAEAYFTELQKTDWYQEQFALAKAEW